MPPSGRPRAIDVPILVGAIVDGGPEQVLNQGIVWDPVTGAGDRYTKRHPVAVRRVHPVPRRLHQYNFFGRLTRSGATCWRHPARAADIAGVQVADSICFDVAYDDGIYAQVERGAQLLTVQTSNATFIHTHQIDQQFAITRLRAMETGRWLAVASTNGVSGSSPPTAPSSPRPTRGTQAVLVERSG